MLLKTKPIKFWRILLRELSLRHSTLKTKMRIQELPSKIYMMLKFYCKNLQPIWKLPIIFSLMLNLKQLKPSKILNLLWQPTLMPEMFIILLSKFIQTLKNKFNKLEIKRIKLIILLPMPSMLWALPIKSMIMLNLILQLPKAFMKKLIQLFIMLIL